MQQTVASLLYEGLFQLDPAMEPQPLLCSGYEYHPDTLTYTLTLRVDAVFSDGSPLTAADVRASLTAAKSSARYGERLSDLRSVTARKRHGHADPHPPQRRAARAAGYSHFEVRNRAQQRSHRHRPLCL